MKRNIAMFLVVMGVVFLGQSNLFAGSIDWLSQQSTEFLRILSRNAGLEGADIVNYNPAACAYLEDGYHVQLGFYSLLKYYDIEYAGRVYESDEPSPAVPFLYGVYKKDSYAGFVAITVPAGGGSLDYKDGIPFMKQNESTIAAMVGIPPSYVTWQGGDMYASSMYLAATLGGAYAFNDKVSASLGLRYIQASREIEGESTYSIAGQFKTLALDTTLSADGIGAVIGVDYKCNDKLNFGLRYESVTQLEFEADTTSNDFQLAHYGDGDKERRDLPAVLGLGALYKYSDEWLFTMSAHYFFITQADDESDTVNALGLEVVNSYDDDYSNGFEVTAGTEYKLLPTLSLSAGYQYTQSGGDSDTFKDFDYSLDSHFLGGGGKWNARENLDICFSVGKVWYIEGENQSGDTIYNKSVWAFGLSGEMKF